jgi:hypothetical protein
MIAAMSLGDALDWFDSHSNAVTALSTVLLAVITGFYAVLAYLLLREQRRQGLEPRVARSLAVERGQLMLRARNLGPGTAVDVTLRAGPGRALPPSLRIANLGTGIDLGESDQRMWPIEYLSPPDEALRVVISYQDRDRRKIWFDVFEVRFSGDEAKTSAGWSDAFSTAKLKRKIFMNIPMKDIPLYFARHWRDDFHDMLVEEKARRVLADALRIELEKLLAWGERYEAVMHRL